MVQVAALGGLLNLCQPTLCLLAVEYSGSMKEPVAKTEEEDAAAIVAAAPKEAGVQASRKDNKRVVFDLGQPLLAFMSQDSLLECRARSAWVAILVLLAAISCNQNQRMDVQCICVLSLALEFALVAMVF